MALPRLKGWSEKNGKARAMSRARTQVESRKQHYPMRHILRKCTAALVLSALLTAASYAQNLPESDRQKAETEKKKADERATDEAYKSTIKRIPDAGQKPDPWGNMRAPAAKGNN